MYPYGQGGQRINSINAQYLPYSNLINNNRIPNQKSLLPNRAPIQHYNNPVYYSNPYSNIIRRWEIIFTRYYINGNR